MNERIMAWYFLREDFRLKKGEWPRAVRPGVTYVHGCGGDVQAKRRVIDALQFAPGPIVCGVQCWGHMAQSNGYYVIPGEEDVVCKKHMVLWRIDATRVLREFSIWCAEQALGRISEREEPQPSHGSLRTLALARRYLEGEATDDIQAERLRLENKARTAEESIVWPTVWPAAWASAWASAWSYASCTAKVKPTPWKPKRSDPAWTIAWAAMDLELERRLGSLRHEGGSFGSADVIYLEGELHSLNRKLRDVKRELAALRDGTGHREAEGNG